MLLLRISDGKKISSEMQNTCNMIHDLVTPLAPSFFPSPPSTLVWEIYKWDHVYLKPSAVECRLIHLIDTLDWHLDPYLIDIPINTRLTLDQQLVDSRWSVNRLICINQKLVAPWLTVNQDVDEVMMEWWWSVKKGVDGFLMEYWSRVSIGTQTWMPLVHVIL